MKREDDTQTPSVKPVKNYKNIESIDIKDIRSSEHLSQKEKPLTEYDVKLKSLSIDLDDSSENLLELDDIGSESEEE